MSGLARLLLTRGIPVVRQRAARLAGAGRAAGAGRHHPHATRPSNLDGVDTVVYSTAIPQDHLELVEARRRGLRVLHRSEALAAAMTGRQTIAVAGTHGKTTTTSMVTLILQHAGQDPSFVIGGEISEVGSNAHHGTGEYFVAEADESDRSFLLYRPYVVDRHQHRRRPPQHVRRPGRAGGGVRRVRPAHRSGRLRGRRAPTTRAPGGWPSTLRADGRTGSSPTATADDADLRLTDDRLVGAGVRYQADAATASRSARSGCRCPVGHLGLNSAAAVLTALRARAAAVGPGRGARRVPGVRRRFERKGVAGGVRSTTSTRTTRPR